jgi:hypothetical protein
MIIKIRIKTPKGAATGMEKKLRKLILGIKTNPTISINEDDSEVEWVVDVGPDRLLKIQKSVTMFDMLVKKAFNNRIVKKMVIKQVGLKGAKELSDMLFNHTEIEVIKDE